ncbi:M14 family zinc carboxypeptidase [Arthrobacter sp. GMC3]|uniref:M14 family zinc carboxypeptidase n=1 Tax=Arthrobacter sp. GMC3 TaxID=2058894 RepID=UPI000CE3D0F2|nr:M14 family zinc carboxypeptidase [Arthrobacter sp. GMC3]
MNHAQQELPGSTAKSPPWLEVVLEKGASLPATDIFPGVDELIERFESFAARRPDLVHRSRIGTSRLGESIPMYSFGTGTMNHLIVAGVHPNEPIGAITALHLAQSLIEDDPFLAVLDAQWHIVPCIDPDGARLNEHWFGRPDDRCFYSRHFYRPARDEQVEWSFPTDYKQAYFDNVIPESQALMRAIDQVKPDLYVALHNGEMGGVYYYLSRPVEELHGALHAIPAHLGLPLDTGEPESPHLEEYAPAIFGMGTVAEAYDFYEALGVDPLSAVSGSSSSEYASRHGTLSLVAELPYWIHPDSDDQTPTDETYRALLLRTAKESKVLHRILQDLLQSAEPFLTLKTPFLTALQDFLPRFEASIEADLRRAELQAAVRPATVAERFGREDVVHCFRLRYGGMLMRALKAETEAGLAHPKVHKLLALALSTYVTWETMATRADNAQAVAIQTLAGAQYAATLAGALVLQEREQ